MTSSDSSNNLSTSLSNNSVNLAPGATGNVTLTATSDLQIPGGSHTVTVTGSLGNLSSSDTSKYTIDATPPSAPTNVSASAQRKQVNITWNVANDNIGVVKYEVLRAGSVIGETQTTSFADKFPVSGTNTYQVRAYDAAGNVSPLSNTASVEFGGGGSKGGGKPGSDDGGGGGGKTEKCSPWPSCR